jgi:hypothetical protein
MPWRRLSRLFLFVSSCLCVRFYWRIFACIRGFFFAFFVLFRGYSSLCLCALLEGSRNILIKSRLYFLGAIRLNRAFPPL